MKNPYNLNIVYPRGIIQNFEYVAIAPKPVAYEGLEQKELKFEFTVPPNTVYTTNTVFAYELYPPIQSINNSEYEFTQTGFLLKSLRAYTNVKGYVVIFSYYYNENAGYGYGLFPIFIKDGYGEWESKFGIAAPSLFFQIYNIYNQPIQVTIYANIILSLSTFSGFYHAVII